MIQKIIKVGTSAAITLPKRSLEVLGMQIGDQVAVEVTEDGITVRPVAQKLKRDKKITELALNFIERYRKDLEELAHK